MALAGRSVVDKAVAIVFPISAFVAAGFEHSVANMYLIPLAMLLQVFGCATMSVGTVDTMYLGLALFLTGSGLNVTCINMMLTQRFAPADLRRESAFFWNYAGMNVGFFVGFAVAGHYQLTESYSRLFLFATIGNFLAIVLAFFNWKALADAWPVR